MKTENKQVKVQIMEGKPKTSEYLSKDILDEDFLKVFEPYRRFQILLGSCRVDARNRFVTVPTVFQKTYTVILCIILFPMYTALNYYANEMYQATYHLHNLSLIVTYIHFFFYLFSIINARFFGNSANTKFYIKLSQIDQVMNIGYHKTIRTILRKLNWFTLSTIIPFFCLVVGLVCFLRNLFMTIAVTALVVTHTTVLIEITFCSNLLVYLAVHIQVVGHMLSRHLSEIENILAKDEESYHTKMFLKLLGSKIYDFKECALDKYLKAIFTAYTHFQNVYRFQIFLFTTKVVLYVVLTFEFALLSLQTNNPDRFGILVLSSLTASDVVVLLSLCVRCEFFERQTKNIKLLSINIMSVYYSGPLRERAKKIYALIEDTPPRFMVYDMWELETRLFIKVCSIVTGFFVTLLQFAFP